LNTIHPDNPSYIDGFHHPEFDQRDADRLAECEAAWNERSGPRVGDFAIMPTGEYHRFSHEWPDGLQTSKDGSFYFGKGFADFSGGLDPSIPNDRIRPTEETRPGSFWFFHHNHSRAHNGVRFQVMCRVYRIER